MADERQKAPPLGMKPYAWLFLMLLGIGAGLIYITQPKLDTPQKVAALPEPPPAAPAQQPAMRAPGFDAVTADESGMAVVAGKAEPGSTVILQDGTETLGETKADSNGDWVMTPDKPLPPGTHSLSVLSVDPKTNASRRSTKSFALTVAPRAPKAVAKAPPPAGAPEMSLNAAVKPPEPAAAKPGAPAAASAAAPKPKAVAGVKSGDSLWRLAHRYYGKGLSYGKIAEANKDRIKNPDLIYPNQQLNIPK